MIHTLGLLPLKPLKYKLCFKSDDSIGICTYTQLLGILARTPESFKEKQMQLDDLIYLPTHPSRVIRRNAHEKKKKEKQK